MGAYEVILDQNNNNPPEDNNGGKGTFQMYGNAQNSPSGQDNDNADTDIISTAQGQGIEVKPANQSKKTEVPKINPQVTTTQTPAQSISYLELYKRLNHRPETNEKEEEKKQRRAQLAAAIGDGVSALSNLFFTYQYAPNSYTGENNITAQNKVTYDKLKKERDEKYAQYLNGYMRAFQADQANADKERAWKRQLERDKKADEISDRDYNFRVNQADQSQKNFEAQLKQQKEIVDANNKEKKEAKEAEIKAKKEIAIANAKAKGIKAVRGNSIVFSDGDNQVQIYGNVWKGSMQGVFNAIIDDMRKAYEADKDNNPRPPYTNSWTEKNKEDFVKQNWAKYPSSRSLMETLSKLDPNNMRAGIEEETPDQYSSLGLNWGNNNDDNDGNNESDW